MKTKNLIRRENTLPLTYFPLSPSLSNKVNQFSRMSLVSAHSVQGMRWNCLSSSLGYVFCPPACMCTKCVPGAYRGQKRVSDPLLLKLLMVLSHCEYWELNLSLLQEQEMLLASELPLMACVYSPTWC